MRERSAQKKRDGRIGKFIRPGVAFWRRLRRFRKHVVNHACDPGNGIMQHERNTGTQGVRDQHGVSVAADSSIAYADDKLFHLEAPRLQ